MQAKPHIWVMNHAAGIWKEHEPLPGFDVVTGRFLAGGAAPLLLDLGCGSGRHSHYQAARCLPPDFIR